MSMNRRKIKRLRLRLGWTQRELADHCGVTEQTVYLWEKGERFVSGPAERILEMLEAKTP